MTRRVAAAVLIGVIGLLGAAATAGRAHAQTAAGSTRLTLVSQTSWVDPVHTPIYALRVATNAPPDAEVLVDVYARLGTRSEFNRTLSDTWSGYQIAHPIDAPLASLHPDAQGAFEVDIPVTNVYRAGQNNLLHLTNSGVYPVVVEIRPGGGGKPLVRMVTTMLYEANPISGPPLHVAWVATIHMAPTEKTKDFRPLTDGLAGAPNLPLTLQVTPDVLSVLDRTDPPTVARIGRSINGREVLSDTWVPMSIPAMLQAG